MTMNRTCATCRWFDSYTTDNRVGGCNRRSPKRTKEGASAWPQVLHVMWCGDHEPREADDAETPE